MHRQWAIALKESTRVNVIVGKCKSNHQIFEYSLVLRCHGLSLK